MIILKGNIPILSWCNNLDDKTIEQAKNMANLPFAFKHVCLMPDAHQGFGMPIGGVLATKNIIVPNAVGVDIGCGMCAIKTNLSNIDKNKLLTIMSDIRKRIPLGFKHHKTKQSLPDFLTQPAGPITEKEMKEIPYQLGTLGGGNHFIEIQKDETENLWIMLHSGSRNIGKKVAEHYHNKAKDILKKTNIKDNIVSSLAGLEINSNIGETYFKEMTYCLEFAKANRYKMIEIIKEIFLNTLNCNFDSTINIHHNYANKELHFGEKLIIHRKGATSAKKGETGIIPGSQGSSSYIVKGKGNPQSFMTCSHGAGRKMGRREAQKQLDLNYEKEKLESKGIIHSLRGIKDLDEAPGSYKEIDTVINEQLDLIDIIQKLHPLAVIKG